VRWRRWNRAIHRDLGYLCFGLTIVYAVSGVVLNHIHEWNPNYAIRRTTEPLSGVDLSPGGGLADRVLAHLGLPGPVRSTFQPDPDTLQIFLADGPLTVDLARGTVTREVVAERPVLRPMNALHLNAPKRLWTWVADLYAVSLLVLAVTGILLVQGRHGLRGRGAWLTALGVALPLVFLVWIGSGGGTRSTAEATGDARLHSEPGSGR